jgi:POT family proton-dependent oligopeptide transporter
MMGVWFLATAASEFIAAILANIAQLETNNGEVADVALAIEAYKNLFSTLFYAGIIIGGFLLLISPFIKKLMHGVK